GRRPCRSAPRGECRSRYESYTPAMWPFRRRAARRGSPGAEGITPRRPHAGQLRREQRALLQIREEKLRDLGGLLVELYRRGGFPQDPPPAGCAGHVGSAARPAPITALPPAAPPAPPAARAGRPCGGEPRARPTAAGCSPGRPAATTR